MLGDRQGWMIEELMPRLGPRNQIGSSPVSRIWRTYLANVFREYREQAAYLRRSKQRLQNERPSPGRRYWPQIVTALIPVAGLSRQPSSEDHDPLRRGGHSAIPPPREAS